LYLAESPSWAGPSRFGQGYRRGGTGALVPQRPVRWGYALAASPSTSSVCGGPCRRMSREWPSATWTLAHSFALADASEARLGSPETACAQGHPFLALVDTLLCKKVLYGIWGLRISADASRNLKVYAQHQLLFFPSMCFSVLFVWLGPKAHLCVLVRTTHSSCLRQAPWPRLVFVALRTSSRLQFIMRSASQKKMLVCVKTQNGCISYVCGLRPKPPSHIHIRAAYKWYEHCALVLSSSSSF